MFYYVYRSAVYVIVCSFIHLSMDTSVRSASRPACGLSTRVDTGLAFQSSWYTSRSRTCLPDLSSDRIFLKFYLYSASSLSSHPTGRGWGRLIHHGGTVGMSHVINNRFLLNSFLWAPSPPSPRSWKDSVCILEGVCTHTSGEHCGSLPFHCYHSRDGTQNLIRA